MRHTFSSSVIYEVPWARERIYGGWQVNGIVYLRSGLPFTVDAGAERALDRHGQPSRPHL